MTAYTGYIQPKGEIPGWDLFSPSGITKGPQSTTCGSLLITFYLFVCLFVWFCFVFYFCYCFVFYLFYFCFVFCFCFCFCLFVCLFVCFSHWADKQGKVRLWRSSLLNDLEEITSSDQGYWTVKGCVTGGKSQSQEATMWGKTSRSAFSYGFWGLNEGGRSYFFFSFFPFFF